MQDTSSWSREQHEAAKQEIAVYKSRLRTLIRDASLYHVSASPDGVHWDGMEYIDRTRRHGVLYAFRGSVADEADHTFNLAGLEPTGLYQLHFQDGSSTDRTLTGAQLMSTGLSVHLTEPYSSEIVFIDSASQR